MPPADRIDSDPGQGARKVPSDTADFDFQAVGPALHILQLKVEGLSAAKRSIIQTLAEKHHIDVICLEQTHVNVDMSNRFHIAGFDIINYSLHAKHGPATYQVNQKKSPPTTFVDITAMHGNFCTKFYTIVKRSNIHFITKF